MLVRAIIDPLKTYHQRSELIRSKDKQGRSILDYDLSVPLRNVLLSYLHVDEPQPSKVTSAQSSVRRNSNLKLEHEHKMKSSNRHGNNNSLEMNHTEKLVFPSKTCLKDEKSKLDGKGCNLRNMVLYANSYKKIDWSQVAYALQHGGIEPEALVDELLTEDGRTLLHLAVQGQNIWCIRLLLKAVESDSLRERFISKQTYKKKKTILHYAVESENVPTVKELLNLIGCDIDDLLEVKDSANRTPLEYHTSSKIRHLLQQSKVCYLRPLCKPATCVVFFNNFHDNELWYRPSAVEEVSDVSKGLISLGITPNIYNDCNQTAMQEHINDFTKEPDVSMLLVIIMTHGEQGVIYDSELAPVPIDTILKWMCCNKALAGTPKVCQYIHQSGNGTTLDFCSILLILLFRHFLFSSF